MVVIPPYTIRVLSPRKQTPSPTSAFRLLISQQNKHKGTSDFFFSRRNEGSVKNSAVISSTACDEKIGEGEIINCFIIATHTKKNNNNNNDNNDEDDINSCVPSSLESERFWLPRATDGI